MNYEEDNRIPPAEDYDDEVIDPKNPPRAFRDDELDRPGSDSSQSG